MAGDLHLEPVAEWHGPTDLPGLLVWLDRTGVTLEEFKTFPAWQNVPDDIKAASLPPDAAKPTKGRQRPPRQPAAQDGTSRAPGSDS